MARKFDLTGPGGPDAAWSEVPPEPEARPDLYDGVLWRRAVAFVLDWILIGLVFVAAWIIGSLLTVFTLGLLAGPVGVILALIPMLYVSLTVGGAAGGTPGMRMMDLSVRRMTGGKPGHAQAFLMAILFYFTITLTTMLILLVGLFTPRNRQVHDLLSDVVVVRASRLQAAA